MKFGRNIQRKEGVVDKMLMGLAEHRKTALILVIAGIVAIGVGLLLVVLL